MARIVLVAATASEFAPVGRALGFEFPEGRRFTTFQQDDHLITALIAGAGGPAFLVNLARQVYTGIFDGAIQIGIAGAYRQDLVLGELVEVVSDHFADLGIDDRGKFIEMHRLPFAHPDDVGAEGRYIRPSVTNLKSVIGATVNTCHGEQQSIADFIGRYSADDKPDIESMEGAYLSILCHAQKIPYLQLRAISNYVEPRNRDRWEIDKALNHLSQFLHENLSQTIDQLLSK